jgi:hypothetical protein
MAEKYQEYIDAIKSLITEASRSTIDNETALAIISLREAIAENPGERFCSFLQSRFPNHGLTPNQCQMIASVAFEQARFDYLKAQLIIERYARLQREAFV